MSPPRRLLVAFSRRVSCLTSRTVLNTQTFRRGTASITSSQSDDQLLLSERDIPDSGLTSWQPIKPPAKGLPLPNAARPPSAVLALLHSFPSLEPLSFATLPSTLLALPFRRDILWQAVVYENDTLHDRSHLFVPNRSELGFSKKKMAPQKGRGRARVGKAGSPIFNKGGKPFGPRHPDDSSSINRRVYNLAIRTAFSYTYQRGNLIVIDGEAELETNEEALVRSVWNAHSWNNIPVLVIVADTRTHLSDAIKAQPKAHVIHMTDLDVRTLLKAKKILVEHTALNYIIEKTQGKEYLDETAKGEDFKVAAKRIKAKASAEKKLKKQNAPKPKL